MSRSRPARRIPLEFLALLAQQNAAAAIKVAALLLKWNPLLQAPSRKTGAFPFAHQPRAGAVLLVVVP
jgi:hypothetical protein